MNSSVAFIDQKLKDNFDVLTQGRFEDKKLYDSINKTIDALKKDPTYGTKIPKRLWPRDYTKSYQITNLWKYNLPDGWRLVYTIQTSDIMMLSIILEWYSHKDYERKFKY